MLSYAAPRLPVDAAANLAKKHTANNVKYAPTQEYPMNTRCRAQSAQPSPAARASLAALATLLLTLTAMPAQAAIIYTFPGKLPAGCSESMTSGHYHCGALTLGAGDTIIIADPRPATITVGGALTIGANALINVNGSASSLNFQVAGTFDLGDYSTMHAHVNTGESAAGIGGYTKIVGNINTGNGVVTTLTSVEMSGDIITTGTTTGTVNIGADNIIKGNVHTIAGVVTTAARVQVNGYIETNAGAINLGANNKVGDSLITQAGVVTIGENAVVGDAANGRGNISTHGGGITVGDSSRLCGSLSTAAGVITMGANIKIGANIFTSGGGITITGTQTTGVSTIGGNLNASAAGAVTLTDVLIGGNVNVAVGAFTLTDTHVRGNATYNAAYTPVNSTINDGTVSFTPACSAAPVIAASSAAAAFNALETGTNIPWSSTERKALYTKLIDTPFTLDIVALKIDGTLEIAYIANGGASKYVKLELFDDVGAACSAYANPVTAQTATFTSASSSGAPGRALSGAFTVTDAHRSLLVRIRECADSTCTSFTSMASTCSSDRFSVRPPALTLSTTTKMGTAPSATAPDTIRAGTDFTLLAKTSPTGNYGGVLTLDATRLTAQLPSEGVTTQSGGAIGVLTPSTLTANANAVMASYSEVGYLYIGIGAYRDDSFTAVDSDVGDCITSTASNANLADTLNFGKYGCSIGNKAISSLGRFVPNHFSTVIATGAAMPCPAALLAGGRVCPALGPAAGFVYSGQPFAVTITALNANGTPTTNYSGLLARDVTLQAWSAPGSSVAASPAGSVLSHSPEPVSAARFVLGVASANLAYTFPTRYPATALAAPTDIYLRARENTNVAADGVTSARAVAATSLEAGVTVTSGRFQLANNYGSELNAAPVMARVQYWDGIRFVNSTTDQKTTISALDVIRSNCKKNLQTGNSCIPLTLNTPASPLVVDGALRLTLTAPGQGKTGSVDLNINSSTSPWLPSTAARIGVGVYKAGPVIYLRENY